jgi:hypothetical protein
LQIVQRRRSPHQRESLAASRPYTRSLLRRYFRVAVDVGRLPSILGGLCFRARVSSYKLRTFEDAVIFVHDIERVLDRIERTHMEVIAGVVFLEYSIPEVALRLGITVQRAERRHAAAFESLTSALLEAGLLQPIFAGQDEAGEPHPSGKNACRRRLACDSAPQSALSRNPVPPGKDAPPRN